MIRSAALCMALVLALSLGGRAGESAHWNDAETGATSVKKAIDFVTHSTGDNEIRAITHDSKVYKYTSAGHSWALEWTVTQGNTGNPPSGGSNRGITTVNRSRVWPQIVSFNGKLFTTQSYFVKKCNGVDYNHFIWPEYAVLGFDPTTGTESIGLQVRGGVSSAWIGHCSYNFYNPTRDNMVNGYLFVSGANVYWGGGGGKLISPAETVAPFTSGGTDLRYVYNSADGANWNLLNRTVGPVGGNDEYGRAIPAAMPDGYRYSHIIEFGGQLWDYYGYYNPATLAFTPKTDDIHTEPWGWHLMGKYTKDGAGNAARLARVGFNKKGDKTSLYEITGSAGTWSAMGAEGRVVLEPFASGGALAQGGNVINDDSLQVFGTDAIAGQDIELPKAAYACTPAGVVTVTAPPFAASGYKATYIFKTAAAGAPNDGGVYWRSCAGVVNTVKTQAGENIGTGNGTLRQFDLSRHAHIRTATVAVTVGGVAKTNGVDYYATASGRVVFAAAPAAGAIVATYQYMNPHDGLYCTYSQEVGGAFSSGVYKYNDEDYDWLWTFKLCKSDPADARTYTGAIFAKPDGSVMVGKSTGVECRAIDPTAPDPVP